MLFYYDPSINIIEMVWGVYIIANIVTALWLLKFTWDFYFNKEGD